jgi:hypothetical protein
MFEELRAASRSWRGFVILVAVFLLLLLLFHNDAAAPQKFGPYQN